MKIEIKTEMAQLTLEMDPVNVFQLIQDALKYAAAMPKQGGDPYEEVTRELAGRAQATLDKLTEEGNAPAVYGAKDVPRGDVVPVDRTAVPMGNQHLVSGFLFTECGACGRDWGWNARIPTDHAKCRCGHKTPLRDLRPVHVKCTCGKSFTYRTNKTEDSFDMECINCNRTNTMVLNAAKTAYVPMGKIKW